MHHMTGHAFSLNTQLKEPFFPVTRKDITDFGTDDEINTFIHEHCVKAGRPVVLSNLHSLSGWDKDLFDLKRTIQIYGEEDIQIQGSIQKKTMPLAAYVDMLKSEKKVAPSSGHSTASPLSEFAPGSSTWSTLSPLTPSTPNQSQLKPHPIPKDGSVNDTLCVGIGGPTTQSLIDETHNSTPRSDPNNTNELEGVYRGIGERVQTGARRRKCNINRSPSPLPPVKKPKRERRSSIPRKHHTYDDDDDDDDDDNDNNNDNTQQQHINEIYYAKDIDPPDEYKECLPRILPPDLLPLGTGDLIRTLPTSLQAVNLMCYLGGNHTGTALHRDISGAIGHNIMTFAEDNAYAQWLVIEKSDTPKLRELCQEDLGDNAKKKYQGQLKKSFFLECERAWVSPDQLAARGVITHVIFQQPGDLVIIPSLCYHQVTNVGISFKMAWNRITALSLMEGMKVQLPLYNIIARPELYRCKATVYFALKDILSNMPTASTFPSITQQNSFLEHCRALLHLYATDVILPEVIEPIAIENVSNDGIVQDGTPGDGEIGFDVVCDFCFSDVFHRYYHCGKCQMDVCLQCYATGRSCTHVDELCMHEPSSSVVGTNESKQQDMNEFIMLYDDVVYQINRTFGPLSIIPEFTTFQHRGDCYSLATTCRRIEIYRKNNKYLSNKLHCSHCTQIFDLYNTRWDIKTIFQHRPCYQALNYSRNSTVFVCFECAKRCFSCSPVISISRLDTELVYFRDMSKNLELWGGSVDKGLFQSACWPDYKIKYNTGDTHMLAKFNERSWTYPEDFMQLAAAALVKSITPEGWKCWARNELVGKDNILVSDLIQRLAQQWTDSYKKVLKPQAILSDKTTYSYKRKSKAIDDDSDQYDNYIDMTNLTIKLPPIVEKRGRPRKHPRLDEDLYKPASRTRKLIIEES